MFDDYNRDSKEKLTNEVKEEKSTKKILLIIIVSIILVLIATLIPIYFIYHTNDELNFLIVSDVHEADDKLDKLKDRMSNKKFDYVLFLGDFIKYDKNRNITDDEKLNIIKELIKKFEEIAPVLYVGGNHDAINLFDENFNLDTDSDKTQNLHKNIIKIKNDLYIAGIGGSIPIINGTNYKKGEIPFSSINTNDVIISGFPYDDSSDYEASDKEFQKDLNYTLDKIKDNKIFIILISHIGPIYSYTSIQKINDTCPMGYLGSKKLFDTFMNNDQIFLNIHGHVHPSRGKFNFYENKTVLNPGALTDSNYATMKIYKHDGKYDIKSSLEDLF
jgi:Icc-related predicted phosphoesterase